MTPASASARSVPSDIPRRAVSVVMAAAAGIACLAVIGVLAAVLGIIVVRGGAGLSVGFFTDVPTGDATNPGGMAHALLGTGILLAVAGVVGVPFGVTVGIYLAELGDERVLPGLVRFTCDVLAGVPSIVVGILGYELVVVPIGHYSGWAGALALAFLMVPIIARTTEEMLRLVPNTLREGALALGATRASTLFRVVIPAATGGILTGVMLALARVAGETAPLLFTALGSRLLTLDPSQPFPSLTAQIFAYATGPYEAQRAVAWAGILILVALMGALNVGVRWLSPGRRSSSSS